MPFGLYIHLPFCKKKCPYCNFSSITGAEGLIESYTEALNIELDHRLTEQYNGSPQTIYIGGGTPSIVPSAYIKKIVERFIPDSSVEFTIEANPESITKSWLDDILKSGANRLSIGIQSLDDRVLYNLGRLHKAKDAILSVTMAKHAGFSNISVDLMFGVPGQTIGIWERTLEEVLKLEPEHISCYCLGVEEDTEYYEMYKEKNIEILEPDKTADMYILMVEMLEKSGIIKYELSNFARRGRECKHNRVYWNFTPYLGIGASAHSFDGYIRSWNENDPERYTQKISAKNEATAGYEILDENKRLFETVMLSLRTRDGLNLENLTGLSHDNVRLLQNKIDTFVESGFMKYCENRTTRLTSRGAVIANEIISDILADIS